MALTTAQTQTVYDCCGLRSGGGDYTLVRFDTYSVTSITDSSLTWDYSSVKTAIDTRIAALDAAEETRLGTFITTYDSKVTSSFRMNGEIILDNQAEATMAKNKIIDIIGVHVQLVPAIEAARQSATPPISGGLSR